MPIMDDDAAHAVRQIARTSRIAWQLLVVVAALTLADWLLPLVLGEALAFHIGPLHITWLAWTDWPSIAASMQQQGWPAFALLLAPRVLLFVATVWQAVRLLRLYEAAQVFTVNNIACLQRIGALSIAWALVQLGYPAVVIALARALQHPYQGSTFESDWSPLYFIVIGLLLGVMAKVMREARRLRDEHALTI